jgi:hypothetical protein
MRNENRNIEVDYNEGEVRFSCLTVKCIALFVISVVYVSLCARILRAGLSHDEQIWLLDVSSGFVW